MSNALIAVKLFPQEVENLKRFGHIRLYGIDEIDKDFPELGRSEIPEEYRPLFCSDEERNNFPEFYIRILGYEEPADAAGDFGYTDTWFRKIHELYNARYVSGYWTISDGTCLNLFSSEEKCLAFLNPRKNLEGYFVRDPFGDHKSIKLTITLV